MRKPVWLFAAILSAAAVCVSAVSAERPPNIILILADDLGYGDVSAYNPQSKISTKNIDRLARQGIRLTDAHSSATCTPSRYALLTGRYMFRTSRVYKKEALIEPGRMTIASLLKQAGYATAMVGKWNQSFEGGEPFDYDKPLRGGPLDHGFDSYFGIHSSLDLAPYFYIENDRVVEKPTVTVEEHHSPGVRSVQGAFWRRGLAGPHFKHEEVLPRFTEKAVEYIESRAGSQQPFFLYFAPPAPHPPWLPTEPFRGKSGAGTYGDFVMQVDDAVGRVIAALKKAGKTHDTLIIVTSDNGPTWYETDVRQYAHHAAGTWRGMKADAWEGGHRIPFVVRWPARIAAGTTSTQLVSFTDVLATFASLTGQKLPSGAGEDSLDVLPVLVGKASKPIREEVVHEAYRISGDGLAIRQGNWKLIPWLEEVSVFEGFGYGASPKLTPIPAPKQQPGGPQGQLYDLASDPGERRNVYAQHPEIVRRLTGLLEEMRRDGSTRP